MAFVLLSDRFDDLKGWPGNLLAAGPGTGTAITKATATEFRATLGEATGFGGYQVVVTGNGFEYERTAGIDGTMSKVEVLDGSGRAVITVSGLSAQPLAGDFAQFFFNMFGPPGTGPGAPGGPLAAWSHLLSGNDVINGTTFNDDQSIPGLNPGADKYNGKDGNDLFHGGLGNDTYNGSLGVDTLSFGNTSDAAGASARHGIVVRVGRGIVEDCWGGTDHVTGMEKFEGSRFDDLFRGRGDRPDDFAGLRGADILRGGQASFDLFGTANDDDKDLVRYDSDWANGGRFGIVADLETSYKDGSIRGTIRDGFGSTDTVIDIEMVWGTRYGDSFTGSRVDNRFAGGEGVDAYVGGAGVDTIDFNRQFGEGRAHGVKVDLLRASGQILDDGFGNRERAVGIEKIVGTDFNDVIRMNGGDDEIQGRDGADRMVGGKGADTFIWTSLAEAGDRDVVMDFQARGPKHDSFAFLASGFEGMTGTVHLVNGTEAHDGTATFLFDRSTQRLYWDANGDEAGGQTLITELRGVTSLHVTDFTIWD